MKRKNIQAWMKPKKFIFKTVDDTPFLTHRLSAILAAPRTVKFFSQLPTSIQ